MEDVDAVIKVAERIRRGEVPRSLSLNKLSMLKEPKSALKESIKERMSFLAACYVSLATFIDDDDVDFLLNDDAPAVDKEKIKRISSIYKKVMRDMNLYREEIAEFDPTELPTAGLGDALDS